MKNCNKIPGKNKGCHFLAGFVIAVVASSMASPIDGLLAGAFIGLAKGPGDEYIYGGLDLLDLLSTLVGVFFGIILTWAIL